MIINYYYRVMNNKYLERGLLRQIIRQYRAFESISR